MVHKPKHKVHSFRASLGSESQEEINLERQNVNLAYRIIKLQVMTADPMDASDETVIKVYRESQTSIDNAIDFNDPDLLAVGFLSHNQTSGAGSYTQIVFDNVLFSRNIFVTCLANPGPGNYYLELEEVPVGAATLMQIKLGTARRLISDSMGA